MQRPSWVFQTGGCNYCELQSQFGHGRNPTLAHEGRALTNTSNLLLAMKYIVRYVDFIYLIVKSGEYRPCGVTVLLNS